MERRVVSKPGKADHTTPGAYRPIALLDTIGKVLSSCVAEDLVKMAEIHQLIPKNHYGCRPGQTTIDALHYVTAAAKDAWQRGNTMAILFLDIKGAFPSVILECLIYDMCSRGIPEEYTGWIKQKVKARCTTICFDNFNTTAIEIP